MLFPSMRFHKFKTLPTQEPSLLHSPTSNLSLNKPQFPPPSILQYPSPQIPAMAEQQQEEEEQVPLLRMEISDSEDVLSLWSNPLFSPRPDASVSPNPVSGFEFSNDYTNLPGGILFCEAREASQHKRRRSFAKSQSCLVNAPPSPSPLLQRRLGSPASRKIPAVWSGKHVFLLGSVKLPPEMELDDLRKRQKRRRLYSSIAPVARGGETAAVGWTRQIWRAHWGLPGCRSILCKNLARALYRRAPRVTSLASSAT